MGFNFIALLGIAVQFSKYRSNSIESIYLVKGDSVADEVAITNLTGELEIIKIEKIRKLSYDEVKLTKDYLRNQ